MGIDDVGLCVLLIFDVVSILNALDHCVPFDFIVVHSLDPLLLVWIREHETWSEWVGVCGWTITYQRDVSGVHVVIVHPQDSVCLLSIAKQTWQSCYPSCTAMCTVSQYVFQQQLTCCVFSFDECRGAWHLVVVVSPERDL